MARRAMTSTPTAAAGSIARHASRPRAPPPHVGPRRPARHRAAAGSSSGRPSARSTARRRSCIASRPGGPGSRAPRISRTCSRAPRRGTCRSTRASRAPCSPSSTPARRGRRRCSKAFASWRAGSLPACSRGAATGAGALSWRLSHASSTRGPSRRAKGPPCSSSRTKRRRPRARRAYPRLASRRWWSGEVLPGERPGWARAAAAPRRGCSSAVDEPRTSRPPSRARPGRPAPSSCTGAKGCRRWSPQPSDWPLATSTRRSCWAGLPHGGSASF